MATQEPSDLWTMTARRELSSHAGIHPSRTSGYPFLKCYSTATWLHTILTHTVQNSHKLDSRSPNSWDESISSKRPSPRAIQPHSAHPTRLEKGQIVAIQRWDTTGQVIETLSNPQYWVRVDGSSMITLKNCRFLRKFEIPEIPLSIPRRHHKPNTPGPQTMDTGITSSTHPPSNIVQPPTMTQKKSARALSRLLPRNHPSSKAITHARRERRRCRIMIIALTTIRVPASVQLSNKNKTNCNSIQSLQQY